MAEDGAAKEAQAEKPGLASLAETLGAVWAVGSPFFRDKATRCKAWGLFAVVVALMLVEVWAGIKYTYIMKHLTNALVQKKEEETWTTLRNGIIFVFIVLPVSFGHIYLANALRYEWRRFLSAKLLSKYLDEHRAYYKLKLYPNSVDNPDQRMGQDVASFCNTATGVMVRFIKDPINLVANLRILWSISPSLVGGSVVYVFLFGILTFKVFAPRIMRYQRIILAREADLRFTLVRTREHSESIAFFHGEAVEQVRCLDVLADVIKYSYKESCIASFFWSLYGLSHYLGFLLPYALLIVPYMNGEVTYGDLTQSLMLFRHVFNAMNDINNEMQHIAKIGAESIRVRQLWVAMDAAAGAGAGNNLAALEKQGRASGFDSDESTDAGETEDDSEDLEDESLDLINRRITERCVVDWGEFDRGGDGNDRPLGNVSMQVQGLSLYPPVGVTKLLSGIDLVVSRGESLLITGHSGAGKSSLLRGLGGLWTRGEGSVRHCGSKNMFFMPQQPYLYRGTLRQNALYPDDSSASEFAPSDDEIRQAFVGANCDTLLKRYSLDDVVDLDSVLSGGEKQRLSFARLLLRPAVQLALLDESTSALDQENERQLYAQLQAKVPSYISVGHRPQLLECHTHRLNLELQSMSTGSTGRVEVLRR